MERSLQDVATQPREDELLELSRSLEEQEAGPAEGSVHLLQLLWQRRRMLGRAVAWGAALAVLYALLLPNSYRASVRLMPPDSAAATGAAALAALSARAGGSLGLLMGDMLGSKASGAVFIGILRSRTVQDRMVERFELQAVYGAGDRESARLRLAGRTGIVEDRKSGIITISVTDGSAQRAAALAAGYVEELDRLSAQLSTSAAQRERVFLEERLRQVRLELDAAAREFSEFASRHTAIDIPGQGRAMLEGISALQGQLIAAQSELKGLEQIYTPGNVRVRAARARVAELEKQLQRLGGAPAAGDAGEATAAGIPSMRQLPLLGVEYAELYRRAKVQETIYEVLTQNYELAKVQEAKETPTVRVLDAAEVPERKAGPPRLLIVMLGAMLGFAVGGVWVLGQARWEALSASDPRRRLGREVWHTLAPAARPIRRRAGKAAEKLRALARRRRREAQDEDGSR